jgi:hypothetical protein
LNSEIQKFKIIIKPDLVDVSLLAINMPEVISDNDPIFSMSGCVCVDYRICDDALVYFWNGSRTWGTYSGLTSAPFTNIFAEWTLNRGVSGLGCFFDVLSLCPASGRFVYFDDCNGCVLDGKTVVVDVF